LSLLVIVGLGGALFGYFVYSAAPEIPQLSGTLANGSIDAGGLRRTFTTYVPRRLPKGSPLVVVLHDSGENAARIRIETGYGFDRLADQRHFAVVYPNAHAQAVTGTRAALWEMTARTGPASTMWGS
jgi:polyhydroxybutyrate depolymerase